MIRSFLSLLIILLVTGCSPKLDDLHAYTQSVKERAQPQIEPYQNSRLTHLLAIRQAL